MVAEGVRTASSVIQLAERHGVEMPICDEVHRVVRGEISGTQAYRGLQPPRGMRPTRDDLGRSA
jgi:glycerol-3-phosphate dehydrogenase (NAD(P)+)